MMLCVETYVCTNHDGYTVHWSLPHTECPVCRMIQESHKRKPRTKKYDEDGDEFRLAKKLLDLILNRKPDFKRPNLQSWAKHIDMMLRLLR